MIKILENSKISTKIITVLLMLGAITIVVAWRGSSKLIENDQNYSNLTDVKNPDAERMALIHQRMTSMVYDGYRTLVYDGYSPPARQAGKQFEVDYKGARDLLSEFRMTEPDAPELTPITAALDKLYAVTAPAVAHGLVNENDTAKQLLIQADQIDRDFSPKLRDMTAARRKSAQARSDELTQITNSTTKMLYIIASGSVLMGMGIAFVMSRSGITEPLGRLQRRMGEIAGSDYSNEIEGLNRGDEVGAMAKAVQVFRENGIAKQAADAAKARADAEQKMVVDTVSTHLSDLSGGDLTTTIKADFPEEYATLKTNFNQALDKLRELIGAVGESALTIRTGAGEIAQASEDLARRTESNAASLEETAASITQMDGRLRASATAASQTVERADQAIATVGGGRAVAEDAVQAMGRVSESAKGIDSVIEGLDKIAFQTRVLAMNAAVEAGRAGDAGRGFAVVADLVSALAMRAEEEAKRARDQLTVTQIEIVTAVEAVQKVDSALADISGDVGQVHNLLATMAADNQAQSAAITQISAAVGTMDQSTQQNAAMVEETSAAARNLASEVGNLSDRASRFKVVEGGSRRLTQAARKPNYADPASYTSPIKPLPSEAISALVRTDSEDWNSF